jgi:hypothetical protein
VLSIPDNYGRFETNMNTLKGSFFAWADGGPRGDGPGARVSGD